MIGFPRIIQCHHYPRLTPRCQLGCIRRQARSLSWEIVAPKAQPGFEFIPGDRAALPKFLHNLPPVTSRRTVRLEVETNRSFPSLFRRGEGSVRELTSLRRVSDGTLVG
jgi:hypothetical protein